MKALDLICRLLQFDTVSSRSNLPLIDWVEEYLLHTYSDTEALEAFRPRAEG